MEARRMDAFAFIHEHKLVSIARQVYGEDLVQAAGAVLEGGIRVLEVTFDQASPRALTDTPRSIAAVKKAFGNEMCVGAGTVMSVDQARAAWEAGADFALAPNVDEEVIAELKRLGMMAVPGAFSPTEIAAASRAGAEIVKIFPVAQLGAAYIKAVRGPLNHIPLMAVGGVTPENVADFLAAGCCSAGIGSNIINAKAVARGDFAGIKAAAAAFVASRDRSREP